MKGKIKLTSVITVCLLMVMTLVGCKYSKSYVNKINKAADKGDYYQVSEMIDKLGEPVSNEDDSDFTTIIWCKGYTAQEYQEELDKVQNDKEYSKKTGEIVKEIIIVGAIDNNVIIASYFKGDRDTVTAQLGKWWNEATEKCDKYLEEHPRS